MNRAIIIGAIVAVFGFLGVSYLFTSKPNKNTDPAHLAAINEPVKSELGERTQGSGSARLIEYYDFQCPSCKTFHNFLKSKKSSDATFAAMLKEKYTFVYRHFPLQNIHPNAYAAATAAEAAGIQGKYFEYVDALFQTQESWTKEPDPTKKFEEIAKTLKLDIAKFKADRSSSAVKAKIEADIHSGLKARIPGTPSFFLNGKRLEFGSFDELETILKANK
jgi:protein-disulfide isomerase